MRSLVVILNRLYTSLRKQSCYYRLLRLRDYPYYGILQMQCWKNSCSRRYTQALNSLNWHRKDSYSGTVMHHVTKYCNLIGLHYTVQQDTAYISTLSGRFFLLYGSESGFWGYSCACWVKNFIQTFINLSLVQVPHPPPSAGPMLVPHPPPSAGPETLVPHPPPSAGPGTLVPHPPLSAGPRTWTVIPSPVRSNNRRGQYLLSW